MSATGSAKSFGPPTAADRPAVFRIFLTVFSSPTTGETSVRRLHTIMQVCHTDQFKSFDVAGLTRINPKQQKHTAVDATAGIDADSILRSTFQKHEPLFVIRNYKCKELLKSIPGPDEVFTILMSGSFDGWDFVSAILDLSGQTIDELHVATLGFSEDNAAQLLTQVDAGKIKHVWFLASCYMRDQHGEKFTKLHSMLTSRGHHCRAIRNHSKIIAMRLQDGTKLVVTGSINLCACKNVELAHVWNDPALFDFTADYVRQKAEEVEHIK